MRELLDSASATADKLLAAHLPKSIQNMIVLADGVTVERMNGDGTALIYTQPPDRQANEYLINRVMGKPTEKTEGDLKVTGGVTIYLPDRKSD